MLVRVTLDVFVDDDTFEPIKAVKTWLNMNLMGFFARAVTIRDVVIVPDAEANPNSPLGGKT